MNLVQKDTPLDITQPETWDQARKFLQASQQFEKFKLFSQAMAGIELRIIQKREGMGHGGKKEGQETFAQLVQRELGISDRHARRLMEMGDAIKKKLKRLPGLTGFSIGDISIDQLGDDQAKALSNAVKKLTDGKTQTELMEELGVYKSSKGGAGGARDKGEGHGVESELELQKEIAARDFAHIDQLLRAYAAKFILLDDVACKAQIATLESHLGFRSKWLSKPRADRSPEETEASVTAALKPIA
ncbi:MAG: hypothetical protein E6R03_00880 [Hyphomicrobiaceae bacterium]|nr:MAG: hypothetical protein E6R03_00880 [Hyphomicrobiaceae bacterium]